MPVRLSVCTLDRRDVPAALGAADPAFAPFAASLAAGANQFTASLVQPDGRIVLAGTTDATNPANADFLIVRLNPDGSPDTTFNGSGRLVLPTFGIGSDDQATSLGRQADGSLVVGGWTNKAGSYDFAAVRISPTGGFDSGFGSSGFVVLNPGVTDKAYALAVGPDDRLTLAGSVGSATSPTLASIGVVRLTAAGQPDTTFNGGAVRAFDLGGFAEARGAVVYSNSTVLVAGYLTKGGTTDTVALRVAADGQFAAANFGTDSFTTGTGEVINFARLDAGGADKGLAVAGASTSNGFVVAGYATDGAAKRVAVSRFTEAGRPDTTFGTGGVTVLNLGGTDDQAAAVLVQPDGRPVAVGFTNAGGSYKMAAVRLTAAGQPDGSFDADGVATFAVGSDDRALAAARDAQGRIVVAGRSAGNVAAGRLIANIGRPSTTVAGGTADGVGAPLRVPAGGTALTLPARNTVFLTPFTAAVRTAAADLNGDGVPELIAVAGPGGAPVLTVRDGATDRVLVQPTNAFEATFTGGLYVAAGDLDGDGRADLVITPDQGGSSRVLVLNGSRLAGGASLTDSTLGSFLGIEDAKFRGGARATVGDLDGDGRMDLIVAAGFGGGPRVAAYNGRTLFAALPAPGASGVSVPARLVPDFFAFEQALRNGTYVTSGDLDGDGRDDLIFGGGPGGGPRVRAVSGRQLLALGNVTNLDAVPAAGFQLANFFAGEATGRGGVPVVARDIDGDQFADIVTASGQGQAARVLVYRGSNVVANAAPVGDQSLDLFASAVLPGGVYVG